MSKPNRILQGIQTDIQDEAGEAMAASNAYLGWKERMENVLKDLQAMDATYPSLRRDATIKIINDLKAAQEADSKFDGDIFARTSSLNENIIATAEKALAEIKGMIVSADKGEANAAFNSYLEWKNRLDKTIAELRTLDCTQAETEKTEVTSVIDKLEATNADDLSYKDGASRSATQLIMLGEKLHDQNRNKCVTDSNSWDFIDRTNPQRFAVPTTTYALATVDNGMSNLVIYGAGATLLLGAVWLLSPAYRKLTRGCVSSVVSYTQSFFKPVDNNAAIDSDHDLNEERVNILTR